MSARIDVAAAELLAAQAAVDVLLGTAADPAAFTAALRRRNLARGRHAREAWFYGSFVGVRADTAALRAAIAAREGLAAGSEAARAEEEKIFWLLPVDEQQACLASAAEAEAVINAGGYAHGYPISVLGTAERWQF